MFSKKDIATVKINSILGPGSELQGSFCTQGSARVDGLVNGDVKITGTLIVGSAGKINGNVEAEAVIIGGEVLGDVIAPVKAELIGSAKVLGDVTTRVIVIDENAVFQGNCNMFQGDEASKEKEQPLKPVKPSDRPVKRTAMEALQDALRDVKEEIRKEDVKEEAQSEKAAEAENKE